MIPVKCKKTPGVISEVPDCEWDPNGIVRDAEASTICSPQYGINRIYNAHNLGWLHIQYGKSTGL